jgi:hypothetical protein
MVDGHNLIVNRAAVSGEIVVGLASCGPDVCLC